MDTHFVQNLIKEILEKMDVLVTSIEVLKEEGSKTTWYTVSVDNPHFFTHKEGEALQSLNHLVKRIVESKNPTEIDGEKKYEGILIDIGGFQKKRVDNVKAIAHMISERARYFKSNVEVDPMSAYDRRIVHEFLANATDLKTESIGFGPTRRVVIKYIGEI
ncbi:MAG: R3H domain-containing nucleic acid-binding protein [Patescibacteria group bacterium]